MSGSNIALLRKKVQEAVETGVVDRDFQGLYQTQYLTLLNEIERKVQNCDAAMSRLMEQYHAENGKKQAFTSMSSVLFNVIQADIDRARRAAALEAEQAREKEQAPDQEESSTRILTCNCGRDYKTMRGLVNHRKTCEEFKAAAGVV